MDFEQGETYNGFNVIGVAVKFPLVAENPGEGVISVKKHL